MRLRLGSLFSGIGGIELGLERTGGFETVFQVEQDEFCRRVLAKHWPDVPRFDDVREVGRHNLPECDVLCGGFPCQDVSTAGLKKGIDGERSGLWREYARVIDEVRPTYAIVENVPGLLTDGMGRVLGDLAEIGYDAEWDCIPASALGAHHRRDRVFIVAYPERERPAARASLQEREGALRHGDGDGTRTTPGWHKLQSRTAGRGATVAHAECVGPSRPRQPEHASHTETDGKGQAVDALDGRLAQVWATEPNVGRVANGVPFGLELLGGLTSEQDDNTEAHTATRLAGWKVLRELWRNREFAAASPHIFGDRLRDIVPGLPCPSGLARWVAETESNKELRDLWEQFYTLPLEETQDMQQALLERARASERRQTLAFKRQRVDRLKSLGNAVVPQVAEYIGYRLLVFHNAKQAVA